MHKALAFAGTLVTCCALTVGIATAQSPAQDNGQQTSTGQSGSSALSAQDQRFLKHLAMGNQAEVELGKMVSGKASNQQVKQFAEKMVQDHTQLSQQLQPILEKNGIKLEQSVSPHHQKLQAKLQGMSGDELDKAYMRAMVRDHRMDVMQVQKAQKSSNPDVKSVTEQALPVLQQHLQLAESTAQQVGVSTEKSKRRHGKSQQSASAQQQQPQ